ncbi:MAG TPA: DNA methyltransferase [Agitococcus sp.]|nr:DNA methyltransferase [Agitococcus sp.]
MSGLKVEYKNIKDLIPYCNNSRTHSDEQVLQIASSIKEFGFTNPVLIDGQGGIIAGHGRIMAAQKLKMDEVPTITLSDLSEAQKKAYIIADNKLALNSGWDDELLKIELEQLKELDFDLGLIGFSDDELALLMLDEDDPTSSDGEPSNGSLADRFLIPPFSVLNAREGWWQDRKRAWLALGIKSEEGRNNDLLKSLNGLAKKSTQGRQMDYSIFDPVLCEIAYRWFSPVGGVVLDPFAGGSVRGIVAAKLGRQYIGHELRKEQVEANREQAANIISDSDAASWIIGDSRNIHNTCKNVQADFIFSCPPYADLEVYSDNPEDLSTLDYADFKKAYFEIIAKTCSLLKHDRFACFVVGEVRDKKGNYYNFVGDTIEAFKTAGLCYYNEAVLLTQVCAKALTAAKSMSCSRKLGKTHQNVLVFVKGDGKKAATACGVVDVYTPDEIEGELLNDNQAKNTD